MVTRRKPQSYSRERFASPISTGLKAKRAKNQEANKQLIELYSAVSPTSTPVSLAPSSSKSVTISTSEQPVCSAAAVGEQLLSDYQVHELPSNVDDASDSSSLPSTGFQSCSSDQTVNAALLAHIEYIEAENTHLRNQVSTYKYSL